MAFNSSKMKQYANYLNVGLTSGVLYLVLGLLWGSGDPTGIVDTLAVPLTVAYGGLGVLVIGSEISRAEKNRINSDLDAIATSVTKRDKAINSLRNAKDDSPKVKRAKTDIKKYTEMQIKHSKRVDASFRKSRSKLRKSITSKEMKEVETFLEAGKKGNLTSISQLAVRKI